ncbi:MAG: hypothetical protein HKM96_15550, partial [Boseongicola sp.]|nr:hypothetical protein [Boseongicola sp.]
MPIFPPSQKNLPIDATADDDLRARAIIFAYVLFGALALALAVSWQNVFDPFVRHDDYPTVFG